MRSSETFKYQQGWPGPCNFVGRQEQWVELVYGAARLGPSEGGHGIVEWLPWCKWLPLGQDLSEGTSPCCLPFMAILLLHASPCSIWNQGRG